MADERNTLELVTFIAAYVEASAILCTNQTVVADETRHYGIRQRGYGKSSQDLVFAVHCCGREFERTALQGCNNLALMLLRGETGFGFERDVGHGVFPFVGSRDFALLHRTVVLNS